MSRRSTTLLPGSRDGTSQRSRRLAALDPSHALIDERDDVEVLQFIREYAKRLRFFEAAPTAHEEPTWADFVQRSGISAGDIAAYMSTPERFSGDAARWLGRPHFALLLTFVKLLGHAREHLNGFTRRHLDHYYRERLAMEPRPPVPDRAFVLFGLRRGAADTRIRAGTELSAGRDSDNVGRIYRTERDIVVNRAAVAGLRSVFVDRRFTGISDVRRDRSLTAPVAFTRTLEVALGELDGELSPGHPVPPWNGEAIDVDFVRGLAGPLGFARARLYLEHDQLGSLMSLVHERQNDAGEWTEINRLLGVNNPADPRDFMANLTSRVGPLDFATGDQLPQVDNVDDLYTFRAEPDVRAFIDEKLGGATPPIRFEDFVEAMQIKRRIDVQWARINRLLEGIGRARLDLLEWSLPGDDPTDFAANLAAALGDEWPPPWPWQTSGIVDYERQLRNLEDHLGMSVQRTQTLASFAGELFDGDTGDTKSEAHDWSEVDRILAEAHREKVYSRRRAQLVEARGQLPGAPAFDAVVRFIFDEAAVIPWADARLRLERYLSRTELDKLDEFREALAKNTALRAFGWPEADALLELVWRNIVELPEPVAQLVEVHNLYAYEDATVVRDSSSAGWTTFGLAPLEATRDEPRGASLGWGIRSPVLSLSEGRRAVTLTLGFADAGFDLTQFLAGLGLGEHERSGDALARALGGRAPGQTEPGALVFEVSTASGWIELAPSQARVVSGAPGDDYWSLLGLPRAGDQDRPALQIKLEIPEDLDPLAPVEGQGQQWPTLRVCLRPRWDKDSEEWRTSMGVFEELTLDAVHLDVDVDGLSALRLQQEDRPLDPKKPFEPFGSRPAVGARLYIDHPELVRARLDSLRFEVAWMGIPDNLVGGRFDTHYANYPDGLKTGAFAVGISLVDRNLELELANEDLFIRDAESVKKARAMSIRPAAVIAASKPGFTYDSRNDLVPAGDLRAGSRFLRWELTPVDFGHGIQAALAATKARELAVKLATNEGAFSGNNPTDSADNYQVNPPYTPKIKQLTAGYSTSIELDPTAPDAEHQLLHVHPFGACPMDAAQPSLMPRYSMAGELYIGLRDLSPPRRLTLLLQLAEGTSDPEVEPAAVRWSYLAGDRFVDLTDGRIVNDSTRGLINSGIIELDLPEAPPSIGRLPSELYWLRAAAPHSHRGVCNVVAIHTQAAAARFADRGNAASHYQAPLDPGAIDRLVKPDANIVSVEQPYSSFGGKPAERRETFDTRVSERLRHKHRALAPWDYERLVLDRFEQIYRAKCIAISDGGVDVVVIPDVRGLAPRNVFEPKAPANLLADIRTYLTELAPAAARIRVRNARYVAVRTRMGVRFKPEIDAGYAQKQLNDDIVRFLSQWAFADGAELMIGGRIYANSIIDFVDRRDYVDYVAEIKLFRSTNGVDYDLIPPIDGEYHVATDRPDQVLVAARDHYFDFIPEAGYQQETFSGINYARIELDFIVG